MTRIETSAYHRPRNVEESELLLRLKWLLGGRLTVAILGIIAILIYQQTFKTFPPQLIAAYIILIGACFINIIYLLITKWSILSLKTLALLQITIDIILETGLVYLTGGIRGSIFIYLYFADIIAASLLVSHRTSFFFASLASIFLSLTTIVYFWATATHATLPLLPAEYVKTVTSELRFFLPYLFFFALVLHIVAFLSGRLAAELNQERTLKERLLRHIVNGLITIDKKGKIVFINEQAKMMLHLAATSDPTGMKVDEMLSDAKYQPLYKTLRPAEKTDAPLVQTMGTSSELEITEPDGKKSFVEFFAFPMLSYRQEIRGTMIVLNDITLKKQMTEMTNRAERLMALRGMITRIAHEIRNPLASIKSASEEINLSNKLTPTEKKLTEIVVKESIRLNQIITDFIDFTRERPPHFRRLNLSEIIEEVLVMLRKHPPMFIGAGATNRPDAPPIQIKSEIEPSLFAEVDPELLKQVLFNLGINALDACREIPDSTKTGEVVFRAHQNTTQQAIIIEVVDNGPGIKDTHLPKIFDPFFTTKLKGVGMGLTVSNRIIQSHHGKIWVETKASKGTKFTLWLPAQQPRG